MRTEILAIKEAFIDDFYAAEAAIMARAGEDHDEEESSRLLQTVDNIAIVSIKGSLTNTNSWINRYFGMTSYDEIRQAVIEGLETAEAMMFHVASPGGRVAGMADLANFISSLPIPTVTFTDETMASAALFLGIQADHVYADSFSEVGSVGVILNYMDYTEKMKKEGVKAVRFRSGDLKQAGSPYFKLTDKETKYLAEQVDLYAEKFFGIVSEARGIPRPMLDSLEITSGRTFIGEQALQAGLVDSMMTFDGAVAKTMELAKKNVDKKRPGNVLYGQ
jgi:signal peptide peptidase SppA